ncbi:MAG: hypothetical protein PVF70_09825 [Anaerolineales bacterium]
MSLEFSSLVGVNLPIYRASHEGQTLYYAPGFLAGVDQSLSGSLELNLATRDRRSCDEPEILQISRKLRAASKAAVQAWRDTLTAPFKPLCLTLYPHNDCNLACTYCYAEAGPSHGGELLSLEAVRSACALVAGNCKLEDRPLVIVFHGGGEPSLHFSWLEQALEIVEGTAAQSQVEVFRYIATNGVMSEEKAGWLAKRFDLIGLSCDGPEAIQTAQRPRGDHNPTTPGVERTARIVRQFGKPLNIRVTITPASLHRQSEIVDYLCETFRLQEIRVEPVYRGGRATQESVFQPAQAAEFVDEFMKARRHARDLGVGWQTSGSRLGEVHGPYCHILRAVLLLVPGEGASICFKSCDASQAEREGFGIGSYDDSDRKIHLREEAITRLQHTLMDRHDDCAGCFNQYHCTRACPDACLLTDNRSEGDFRCQVQKLLSSALLEEAATQHANGRRTWHVSLLAKDQ